ncbi:MAG: hypothetical protein HS115_19940 [Spirochaetales bacterium]|nr:hypothetical protein [Spirochaetales bacterium]
MRILKSFSGLLVLALCPIFSTALLAEKVEGGVSIGYGNLFSDLEARTRDDAFFRNGQVGEGQAHGPWRGNFASPYLDLFVRYQRELTPREIKDETRDMALLLTAREELRAARFTHGVGRYDKNMIDAESVAASGRSKREYLERNRDYEAGLQFPLSRGKLFLIGIVGQREHEWEMKVRTTAVGLSQNWAVLTRDDKNANTLQARALGQYAGGGIRYLLARRVWFLGEYRHFQQLQGKAQFRDRQDDFFLYFGPGAGTAGNPTWAYRQLYSAGQSGYLVSGYGWNAGVRIDLLPFVYLTVKYAHEEMVRSFPQYVTAFQAAILAREKDANINVSTSSSVPAEEKELISDYLIFGRKQAHRSSHVQVSATFALNFDRINNEYYDAEGDHYD